MIELTETESQRRTFRDAMGLFTTGVTIITTTLDDQIHGMTANGFMSVSLEPRLIVVSIGERAKMRGLLDRSGTYGVSVLSAEQKDLSSHFAGRPKEAATIPFVDMSGVPVIEGALTRVAARVVGTHGAGDHVLFIGEVLHVELEHGDPLIFHGGAYRALEAPQEFSAMWHDVTDWF